MLGPREKALAIDATIRTLRAFLASLRSRTRHITPSSSEVVAGCSQGAKVRVRWKVVERYRQVEPPASGLRTHLAIATPVRKAITHMVTLRF